MNAASSISQIASLMADPKRSAMLWALIDGTPRLANELAVMTGLTSSSACAHLSLLSSAGLLRHEARGRKRYFRLATPQVGAAVEALASVQLESARGGAGQGTGYHRCPCRYAGRVAVAIDFGGGTGR
ncbi:ArsR family transcriptional regulator [Pseudomonas putida S11]|nr:ArsR family transcriptional regulator [Pseudomonas putida S11]